jgi:hypothetical protein
MGWIQLGQSRGHRLRLNRSKVGADNSDSAEALSHIIVPVLQERGTNSTGESMCLPQIQSGRADCSVATARTSLSALVFQVARSSLIAKVHKRFNVRILELLDTVSGSTVELEGNRLPMTHSKDVIDLLS